MTPCEKREKKGELLCVYPPFFSCRFIAREKVGLQLGSQIGDEEGSSFFSPSSFLLIVAKEDDIVERDPPSFSPPQ